MQVGWSAALAAGSWAEEEGAGSAASAGDSRHEQPRALAALLLLSFQIWATFALNTPKR